MYNAQKRFLAFMLAFAMIFTSVGTDLNVSFAASGNRADFQISGADLVEAVVGLHKKSTRLEYLNLCVLDDIHNRILYFLIS